MAGEGSAARSLASAEERAFYAGCFACGPENPEGLDLEFTVSDGRAWALFQPRPVHQGWPRALHGGLVATLLDEAAAHVAYARGERAATVRLALRFRRPAPLDQPLRVEARLVRATRRLLEVHGEVTTLQGQPLAEAKATLLLLTESQKRAFGLREGGAEGGPPR